MRHQRKFAFFSGKTRFLQRLNSSNSRPFKTFPFKVNSLLTLKCYSPCENRTRLLGFDSLTTQRWCCFFVAVVCFLRFTLTFLFCGGSALPLLCLLLFSPFKFKLFFSFAKRIALNYVLHSALCFLTSWKRTAISKM